MAGHLGCQHPKMTKSTFLEKGPETGDLRPSDASCGPPCGVKWCALPNPARGGASPAQFRRNVWQLPGPTRIAPGLQPIDSRASGGRPCGAPRLRGPATGSLTRATWE
jgi:hypothetical protein